VNHGIRDRKEELLRDDLVEPGPDDQAVLILNYMHDLNFFYRYMNRISADYPDRKCVLVAPDNFRTKISLKHPALDWFLLADQKPYPLTAGSNLYSRIRALTCREAVIIDPGKTFDLRAYIFLRFCGISDIRLYNFRGAAIPIKTSELFRWLIYRDVSTMTVAWEGCRYIRDFFSIVWRTVQVPLELVRIILTRIFLK